MKSLPLVFLLVAAPVFAQVEVDARLEKTQFLEGEPIFVIVDVTNTGDEAVGYSACDGDVALTVTDAPRRIPPDISGCDWGLGSERAAVQSTIHLCLPRDSEPHSDISCVSTPCSLAHTRWSRPVKRACAGSITRRRRKRCSRRISLVFRHRQSPGIAREPVPGAQFGRTFEFTIAQGTQQELERAFAGYVADANGPEVVRRGWARAAIIEGAPSFLEPLIARVAAEDLFDDSAVDALGRIGTPDSRSSLKRLFRESAEPRRRSSIALALARVGHRGDAAFLADVLLDGSVDQATKSYATLGLGHIGGDQSVRYLDSARASVPDRSYIAAALGNTRSRVGRTGAHRHVRRRTGSQ